MIGPSDGDGIRVGVGVSVATADGFAVDVLLPSTTVALGLGFDEDVAVESAFGDCDSRSSGAGGDDESVVVSSLKMKVCPRFSFSLIIWMPSEAQAVGGT